MPAAAGRRRLHRDAVALMPRTPFPFSAIVGQDEMKLALLIAAVDRRRRRARARRPRHRQIDGRARARRPSAADAGRRRLPVPLRSRRNRLGVRRLPAARPRAAARERVGAGAGRGPAAGRDGGPRRRCARSGTRTDARREERSSRACWRAPIAAFSTSTRSTCWRIISSICCSTWRPLVRTWSSAKA